MKMETIIIPCPVCGKGVKKNKAEGIMHDGELMFENIWCCKEHEDRDMKEAREKCK